MVSQTYARALGWVLIYEGGYVNHPRDPGGATNKGVTQRVYNAFRRRLGLAVQSVKAISDGEVAALYKSQYWDRVQGDALPAGVDFAVFDGAVNSGVSRSAKWLQKAAGVKADGVIGNITLAAVADASPEQLITDICRYRMTFLRRLKIFVAFGRGWTRRVEGAKRRFQSTDTGVLDRAIMLARKAAS